MSYVVTRKALFLKIRCKKDGLYPGVKVGDPQFETCAEEALFALFSTVDQENISATDNKRIKDFLHEFVRRTREFWRKKNVKSIPENMFRDHKNFFEEIIDFGDLTPVATAVVGPHGDAPNLDPDPDPNPDPDTNPEGC